MEREEISAICRTVLEDRQRKKAPMRDPVPLVFRSGRFPRSPESLSAAERRQAVAAGKDGVGLELSPEAVFEDEAREEGLDEIEIWDVHDAAGQLAYRVWIYGVDNATVFRGETIEIVAGCSQGGLESDDRALVDELIAARKRIPPGEVPENSCVRFLGR